MGEESGYEPLQQPRRADAVANRQRLLDAARTAFAEIGATAEVKDIAERAGVGVGTIYRHFGSKEDLLREVVLEANAEFDRDIEACEGLGDPIEAIRQQVSALLSVTEHYGWLFDAILGGQLPERVTEALDERAADVRVMSVLSRAVEEGALDPQLDVDVAANLLLGLAITWKYGKLSQRMSPGDAVDRTLHLFLRGAERRA